jgi:hypothetical protein
MTTTYEPSTVPTRGGERSRFALSVSPSGINVQPAQNVLIAYTKLLEDRRAESKAVEPRTITLKKIVRVEGKYVLIDGKTLTIKPNAEARYGSGRFKSRGTGGAFLDEVFLGEKFTGRKLAGLALGMAALVLLLGDGLHTLGSAPLGSLLVVGASVSWALGTVMQKRYPVSMQAAAYTAWIMLLGGLPIIAGALLFDDLSRLGNAGGWPVAGLLYNIFVAFAVAHWAWIKIATSVPVGVFSLSMLVIPVVGVISGMVFLGERPSWVEYAALVLVLASLLTVVIPARQSR